MISPNEPPPPAPPAAAELHFYYDFVCPYAYLASRDIDALATRTGAKLVWHPVLLGGVFRAIGAPDQPRMAPGRARYNELDLERQARAAGVTLKRPEGHPRRTVAALRAAIAAGEGLPQATRALYDAYWGRGEDVERADVIGAALARVGLDARAILERAASDDVKAELRRITDSAVQRQIFGAPSVIVETSRASELFWGNDRLALVEQALLGKPADEASAEDAPAPARQRGSIDFYFDFSSPFAYLGSTRIRRLARRAGASLEYRPILLGGLFKAIGTGNVPLFEMPPPKQRYVGAELDRWARRWNVPYRFASRFPINTTKALRAVLLAPIDARPDLVDAIFEATWALDRDMTSEDVLGELLARTGCDAEAILPRLGSDEVKHELKARTDEAATRGVFGVPTFFVRANGTAEEMYWGQDRIPMVEAALLGR